MKKTENIWKDKVGINAIIANFVCVSVWKSRMTQSTMRCAFYTTQIYFVPLVSFLFLFDYHCYNVNWNVKRMERNGETHEESYFTYPIEVFPKWNSNSVKSANLESLINHWNMIRSQFKVSISHICLADALAS